VGLIRLVRNELKATGHKYIGYMVTCYIVNIAYHTRANVGIVYKMGQIIHFDIHIEVKNAFHIKAKLTNQFNRLNGQGYLW